MRLRLLTIFCLFLAMPARADGALVVFAAASLAGPLDRVAEAWDGEAVVSYAGSAVLARQVTAGARADLVILANTDWMDHLVEAGAVAADQVRPLLTNRLALVTRTEAGAPLPFPDALAGLPAEVRIATGFVEAVPVGIYARQALERVGRFDDLRDRLVQVENARLALALVARGDVEAALIYQSDAQADPRVTALAPVDAGLHDPILYPAAALLRSSHPDTAAFLDHLASDAALAVFYEAGFRPVDE